MTVLYREGNKTISDNEQGNALHSGSDGKFTSAQGNGERSEEKFDSKYTDKIDRYLSKDDFISAIANERYGSKIKAFYESLQSDEDKERFIRDLMNDTDEERAKETFVDEGDKTIIDDEAKKKILYRFNALFRASNAEEFDHCIELLRKTTPEYQRLFLKTMDFLEGDIIFDSNSSFYSPSRKTINLEKDILYGNSSYAPYDVLFHETSHAIDGMIASNDGHPYGEISSYFKSIKTGKTLGETLKEECDAIDWDALQADRNQSIEASREKLIEISEKRSQITKQYEAEEDPIKKKALYQEKLRLTNELNDSRNKDNYAWADISDVRHGYTKGREKVNGWGHSVSYWYNDSHRTMEFFAEFLAAKASNQASLEVLSKYLPKSCDLVNEIIEKYGRE